MYNIVNDIFGNRLIVDKILDYFYWSMWVKQRKELNCEFCYIFGDEGIKLLFNYRIYSDSDQQYIHRFRFRYKSVDYNTIVSCLPRNY